MVSTLILCLAAAAPQPRTPGLMLEDLSLAQAVDRAAGVSLVEVVSATEHDERPSDGDLYVRVVLTQVKASGDTQSELHIVKAWGGMRPPGPPPAPDPLNPNPFEPGKRYYMLWSSREQWVYPGHRLLAWWPQDRAPKAVREALAGDRYAWRPQYEPKTGLSYGWKLDEEGGQMRIRVRKGDETVWTRTLPGVPAFNFEYNWRAWPRMNVPNLDHVPPTPSNLFLCADLRGELPEENPYDVPAGGYRLIYYLELDTGRVAAIEICQPRVSHAPFLLRVFDRETGRAVRDRRWQWLESGGKAVGAETESWLRQIVSTYDPQTGEVLSRQVYRIDGSTPVRIDGEQR